jgi:oxygen-independent coproporphyrinogen-3 oxidase
MSAFESAGEYLILRLRTTHGISEEEYNDIYRLKMDLILELLRKYENEGWVVYTEGRWRFTPGGFLRSNTLIGNLLEAQTRQRAQISKPWQDEPGSEDPQMTLFDNRPVAAALFGSRKLVGQQYYDDNGKLLIREGRGQH